MSKFEPTNEQWELMKKHIKSDAYKKSDFFVFETLAVGNRIVPNRYMKLMPDLLNVMKEDAKKGVSLMLNHNWSQIGVQSIPIGKVFDARIGEGTQDGETEALYTTQYILRDDSKVDGYSKNDIIKLIESGILADTSVGWGTDRESYKCSICGNSIYDYRKCEHIPGRKYIVDEDSGEVQECIIHAHAPKNLHAGNNVLMENSIVFDGAYPNAIIQSATGDAIETSNGTLKVLNGKEQLSEKDLIIGYSTGNGGVNLLYKQSQEKGGLEMDLQNKNEVTELENEVTETNASNEVVEQNSEVTETVETTTETVENANSNEEAEAVTETVEETAEATDESVAETSETEAMSTEADILEKFGNIANSVEELISLAQEGLENRNAVIANALNSGVHSMGNAFNKEVFAKTFSNMKTKDIEEMAKVWEEQADAQFVKEKVSKQELTKDKQSAVEFKRVDMSNYKTSNY